MVITEERLKEIREKIACPQLGDGHYGEWGHLPLGVRKTIEALCWSVEVNRAFAKSLVSLPNCNDCAIVRQCEFAPRLGADVRINCPLHVERKEKKKCVKD